MRVAGAVNHTVTGSGTGNLKVTRDQFGIASVAGSLNVPNGAGESKVTVDVNRAWILPLWAGQVSVVDPAAKVNVTAPVFGQIYRGAGNGTARGTSNWFVPGTFPNLIQPFSLEWSVVDAD